MVKGASCRTYMSLASELSFGVHEDLCLETTGEKAYLTLDLARRSCFLEALAEAEPIGEISF